MLTIPKTPKTARGHRYVANRCEDPPKFRLSDGSPSPLSNLNPFFANIEQSDSVTIGARNSKPAMGTENNYMTPRQIFMSTHQKRQSPPPCSIIRQVNREKISNDNEIAHSSTITISDSDDSELKQLDVSLDENPRSSSLSNADTKFANKHNTLLLNQSDSDSNRGETDSNDDLPPRPYSEPLFVDAPAVQIRPSSAANVVQDAKPKRPFTLKRATVCVTPRCARPTKAWLARVESKYQEPAKAKPPKSRTTLNEMERREVWERLWAPGAAVHFNGHE